MYFLQSYWRILDKDFHHRVLSWDAKIQGEREDNGWEGMRRKGSRGESRRGVKEGWREIDTHRNELLGLSPE